MVKKSKKSILGIWKKYPVYRDIQISTILTSFFNWSSFIAMLFLLGEITNSGIELGVLWALSGLSPLIFTAFLGVYLDRWNKKRSIIYSDFLRSLAFLLFLFIPFTEGFISVFIFFISRFFTGLLSSFNSTAKQVVIPQIVQKEDLVVANSYSYMITSTVRLSGAAVGGVIVSFFGINIAYLLTALSCLFSSFLIARHNWNEGNINKNDSIKKNFWKELLSGLAFARNNLYVKMILISSITVGTIIGSYNLMLERYSSVVYAEQEYYLSLLYISEGITSVLIGYFVAKKNLIFKKKWKYGVLYVATGLAWILFSFSTNIVQGILSLILFGLFSALIVPFERFTMQNVVPDYLRGKVFSLWGTLTAVAIQGGALITGFIIDFFGIQAVNQVTGSFHLLFGLIFTIIFAFNLNKSQTISSTKREDTEIQ